MGIKKDGNGSPEDEYTFKKEVKLAWDRATVGERMCIAFFLLPLFVVYAIGTILRWYKEHQQ